MVARGDLTDREWQRLQRCLPVRTRSPKGGRPPRDDRTLVNGMIWLARTGAPWRDLPERFGPWQTVYDRFATWRRDQQWPRILQAILALADQREALDWSVGSVDSTSIRAHAHAAGARKTAAGAAGKKGDPARSAKRWGAAVAA
jgi:transposase